MWCINWTVCAYSTHSYSSSNSLSLSRAHTHSSDTQFFSFLFGGYVSLLRKMCDWFYPIQTRLNVKFLFSVWLAGVCMKGERNKITTQKKNENNLFFSHRAVDRFFSFSSFHFFVCFCFALLSFHSVQLHANIMSHAHTKHFLHESFRAFFLFCGFLFIIENRQPQTHTSQYIKINVCCIHTDFRSLARSPYASILLISILFCYGYSSLYSRHSMTMRAGASDIAESIEVIRKSRAKLIWSQQNVWHQ